MYRVSSARPSERPDILLPDDALPSSKHTAPLQRITHTDSAPFPKHEAGVADSVQRCGCGCLPNVGMSDQEVVPCVMFHGPKVGLKIIQASSGDGFEWSECSPPTSATLTSAEYQALRPSPGELVLSSENNMRCG